MEVPMCACTPLMPASSFPICYSSVAGPSRFFSWKRRQEEEEAARCIPACGTQTKFMMRLSCVLLLCSTLVLLIASQTEAFVSPASLRLSRSSASAQACNFDARARTSVLAAARRTSSGLMYMSSDLEAKVSEVEMRHALEDRGNIAERLQVSKSTCRREGRGILEDGVAAEEDLQLQLSMTHCRC